MTQDVLARVPAEARRSGANDLEIADAQRQVGHTLPSDFVHFLRRSNGAEGYLRPSVYVQLFRAGDLKEINAAAAVDEFAPGFLIFGSDGQGTSYAFDYRRPGTPVVAFKDEQMSRESATVVASSFTDFVHGLSGER
jgi:hypothetical protein